MSERKVFRQTVLFFSLGLAALLAGCAGSGPANQEAPPPEPETRLLHPDQWPRITADTTFPRESAGTLGASGFPDHLHSYWWPDWQIMTLPDGTPYGPGAFCYRKQVKEHSGLVLGEGFEALPLLRVEHDARYAPCDMLPLLETLDWARRDVGAALGLSSPDTLTVISPDNINIYRQMTGQDVWRLYRLEGDRCVLEPYGTLQARTLDGHAVFQLMTDWLLRENAGQALPAWLHMGLVAYMAEDGVHLMNYMREFRAGGEVLLSAPIVDALFARGVDTDRDSDRMNYRRARYSAFLMVWRLVEDNGGLQAMRGFLERVAGGESADQASRAVYGLGIAELAISLDATKLGEPVWDVEQYRKPQVPPVKDSSAAPEDAPEGAADKPAQN